MPRTLPTFEVDKEGLRKLLTKRGPGFAVWELIQNAWDEDAHEVMVGLTKLPRGKARLVVRDDDPDGFTDLRHAYTLFAESEKKVDAEKRGRFNIGEKLVIAICEEATIATTTGTVRFTAKGREMLSDKTDVGSEFSGVLKMSATEFEETVQAIGRLIPPPGIDTYFNGTLLEHREPVADFQDVLPTEIADSDGRLKRTFRKTTVRLYEPLPDEEACIYEMGIPVVATGDRWHVDVQQKVPLNIDRDNVTPAYLRELRRVVLDHSTHLLDAETAQQSWVTNAMEDPKISAEAVEAAIHKRFGDKVVMRDLSDQEANNLAFSEGYTVLSSRTLPKAVNAKLKEFGTVLPAGQVTPSPKPYKPGQGSTRKTLPPEEWTDGMRRIAEFSRTFAHMLMERAEITVEIVNDKDAMNFVATYGRGPGNTGMLEFNLRRLGRKWFEQNVGDPAVISLLIHEFGHHYEGNHLDREYLNSLTMLGARAVNLALNHPAIYTTSAYNIPKAAHS